MNAGLSPEHQDRPMIPERERRTYYSPTGELARLEHGHVAGP